MKLRALEISIGVCADRHTLALDPVEWQLPRYEHKVCVHRLVPLPAHLLSSCPMQNSSHNHGFTSGNGTILTNWRYTVQCFLSLILELVLLELNMAENCNTNV